MPYTPDPAQVLAVAVADTMGDYSDEQQAAMLLCVEIIRAALACGWERDAATEAALFKGDDHQRLAAAQQIVSEIPSEFLAPIFARHGIAPKS